MRFRNRAKNSQARNESGYVMSEYVVISLGLILALIAAVASLNLLLSHHERASATMQLPL